MRTLIFLFTLLLPLLGFTGNQVVYFGGGTSREALDRNFDDSLIGAMDFSKTSGWSGEFYYRKNLPKELSVADGSKVSEFSQQAFKVKVDQLIADISSGKIQPGEQLLVVLASHGANDNGRLVVESDTDIFNVDQLKDLAAAAEAKGVKLGIIGGTCYAGSLMKYKGPHTCVITTSSSDGSGSSGDTNFMLKDLAGKDGSSNLEEIYLKNRYKAGNLGMGTRPMISTEAGIATDEILYPLKPLISRAPDLRAKLAKPLCVKSDLAMETLLEAVELNNEITVESVIKGSHVDYDDLKAQTRAYNELFDKAKEIADSEQAKVCINYQGKKVCDNLGDIEKFFIKKTKGETLDPKLVEIANLLGQTSDYQNYLKAKAKSGPMLSELEKRSQEISKSERKLYDSIYRRTSEKFEKQGKPNPCKDFKI